MKDEYKLYIGENKALFTLSRNYNPQQLEMLFLIYNDITGETKKKTSCGRCLTNMAKTIWKKYQESI
jgi:hypothetical protein